MSGDIPKLSIDQQIKLSDMIFAFNSLKVSYNLFKLLKDKKL